MKELQLIVTQTQGCLRWDNYQEVEDAVRGVISEYRGVVYTEDMVKEAKADRAALNKLKKAIDDKRKSLEKEWMAPFKAIKEKAGTLTGLIDEQVREIDTALTEYESQRKEAKQEEIRAHAENITAGFSTEMRAAFWNRFFDSRWLNATAKAKEWKAALEEGAETVARELEGIEALEEGPVRDMARDLYERSLDFSAAVQRAKETRELKKAVDAWEIKAEPIDPPREEGLLEELAMLAEEPMKEPVKVLCIQCEKGKGANLIGLYHQAAAMGLKAWYEVR